MPEIRDLLDDRLKFLLGASQGHCVGRRALFLPDLSGDKYVRHWRTTAACGLNPAAAPRGRSSTG